MFQVGGSTTSPSWKLHLGPSVFPDIHHGGDSLVDSDPVLLGQPKILTPTQIAVLGMMDRSPRKSNGNAVEYANWFVLEAKQVLLPRSTDLPRSQQQARKRRR